MALGKFVQYDISKDKRNRPEAVAFSSNGAKAFAGQKPELVASDSAGNKAFAGIEQLRMDAEPLKEEEDKKPASETMKETIDGLNEQQGTAKRDLYNQLYETNMEKVQDGLKADVWNQGTLEEKREFMQSVMSANVSGKLAATKDNPKLVPDVTYTENGTLNLEFQEYTPAETTIELGQAKGKDNAKVLQDTFGGYEAQGIAEGIYAAKTTESALQGDENAMNDYQTIKEKGTIESVTQQSSFGKAVESFTSKFPSNSGIAKLGTEISSRLPQTKQDKSNDAAKALKSRAAEAEARFGALTGTQDEQSMELE